MFFKKKVPAAEFGGFMFETSAFRAERAINQMIAVHTKFRRTEPGIADDIPVGKALSQDRKAVSSERSAPPKQEPHL